MHSDRDSQHPHLSDPRLASVEPIGRPANPELPIAQYEAEIVETVKGNDTTVIVGSTGSGKTTLIPLFYLESAAPDEKIAITQPRRVAARSVADYVAELYGCRVGEEIGYTVRFDDQTSEGTRVNFMTEGVLLRKMHNDPLLREYTAVMVDEAHERNLHIDILLGLLKRLQRERLQAGLPQLKIIVASATLEQEKLQTYFDGSPLVEVPGRLHPVNVQYSEKEPYDYPLAAAEVVESIINKQSDGDILIFMPGMEEINQTIRHIENLEINDAIILPLHGQLSPEDQDKIFDQRETRRKIIVSTNMAETSVTVPGIRHVIDSGLIKQIEYDPSSGIESLRVVKHAKSGCTQRAGRAGRVAPGDCYRLYTERDFNDRREFQLPEIQRSNLAHVVLQMKKIGITEVEKFDFIDPPDPASLTQAIETLSALGALDESGELSEIGKLMAELPLEPHIARMVVEAKKYGCLDSVCTIAAFLGGRSVMSRPKDKQYEADSAHQQFKVGSSDFLTLLNVWRSYSENKFSDHWARANFLNAKVLGEVRDVRYQLLRILKSNGLSAADNADDEAISKSIAAGLIENLMEYYGRHSYRRVKDGMVGFFIHPSSATFGAAPNYFVPAEIVATSKTYARVCQRIKPEWLREIAPQLVREVVSDGYYDLSSDRVQQEVGFYLKGSNGDQLDSEQREVVGQNATAIFAKELERGTLEYDFLSDNRQVVKTMADLYIRSAGESPPALSPLQMVEMYQSRLGDIASNRGLLEALANGQIDLKINLDDYISPEARAGIIADNPDTVKVSGEDVRVEYVLYGEQDFRAKVKLTLEQIIGLKEDITIPSGKTVTIEAIDQLGGSYKLFEGTDLAEVKMNASLRLIQRQWDNWRRQQSTQLMDQPLTDFDPLHFETGPTLPAKLAYGENPLTGEPLYAYPALTASVDNYGYNKTVYSIRYYSSSEEAKKAEESCRTVIMSLKENYRIEREKAALLPDARLQYELAKDQLASMSGLYSPEIRQAHDLLARAGYLLEDDPKSSLAVLSQVQDIVRDREARTAELAATVDALRPRLVNLRGIIAKAKEVGDNFYRYELPGGIKTAISQLSELEVGLKNETLEPDKLESMVASIEQLVENLDLTVLANYMERISVKNWGIYAYVEIKNGGVFRIQPSGEREHVRYLEIGRSGRSLAALKSGPDRVLFKTSGEWGWDFELRDGSYAIGRDGSYAFQVRFNEAGAVQEVLGDALEINRHANGGADTEQPVSTQEFPKDYRSEEPVEDSIESDKSAYDNPYDNPFAAAFLRAGYQPPDAEPAPLEQTSQPVNNWSEAPSGDRIAKERPSPTESQTSSPDLLESLRELDSNAIIEEVKELVRKNVKPRRRAFLQAILIERGPEVVARASISEAEYQVITNQLFQALKEENQGQRQARAEELADLRRQVEKMFFANQASKSDLAIEYIGDDPNEIISFQSIFLSLIKDRTTKLSSGEIIDLTQRVIDIMTT